MLIYEIIQYLPVVVLGLYAYLRFGEYDVNNIGLVNSFISLYVIRVTLRLTFFNIEDIDKREFIIKAYIEVLKTLNKRDKVISLGELTYRSVQLLESNKYRHPFQSKLYDDVIQTVYVLKANILTVLKGHPLGVNFRIRIQSLINTLQRLIK